jgi:hypothetical protein
MKRRHFVGSALTLAAAWPLRGFTTVVKGVGDVPARTLAGGEMMLPGSLSYATPDEVYFGALATKAAA